MKKHKPDHITYAATQYLKKRKYIGSSQSYSLVRRREHNIFDMTLSTAVSNHACTSRSFTFSNSSTVDPAQCDLQFKRLIHLAADAGRRGLHGLDNLLLPVLGHMFLELLISGNNGAAHAFYTYHGRSIKESPDQIKLSKELDRINSIEEFHKNKVLLEFRRNRYHVRISFGAHELLVKYFSCNDNALVLQICNQYIDLYVTDPTAPPISARACSRILPHVPPKRSHSAESAVARQFHESSCTLRQGTPTIPKVSLFTLTSTVNVCDMTLSPNGQLVAACYEDGCVQLLERVPHQKLLPTRSRSHWTLVKDHVAHRSEDLPDGRLYGHTGPVYSAAFTKDNQYLLSTSYDQTVGLWSTKEKSLKSLYHGHNACVWDIALSQHHPMFITGSMDRTARFWTIDRIHPLRTLAGHMSSVGVVALHPNTCYGATASSDGTIRLWSVNDAHSVRLLLPRHGIGCPTALAFSPNGHVLASAGNDGCVKLWDIGSGRQLGQLEGHSDSINFLSFNPQGTLMISGGQNGCMFFWDVRPSVLGHLDGLKPSWIVQRNQAPYRLHTSLYVQGGFLVTLGSSISLPPQEETEVSKKAVVKTVSHPQ